MRRPYEKLFKDRTKLNKMIELRLSGMSYVKIAEIFDCDHTSIIYQVKKLKLEGIATFRPKKKRPIPSECCPICEMLLSSKYHQKYPCA